MYPPSGTPPLLPKSLPTLSPPLHLLSTNFRVDRPEVTLPPHKRLGIALGPRYEVGESSSAPTARPPRGFRADYSFVATIDREIVRDLERDVSYRITDTWDEMLVDMPGTPATDDTELDQRMIEFTTLVIQDTYEIYTRGYVTAYYCIGSASSDYKVAGSGPQEIGGDYRVAGSRPHETGTALHSSNTDPETTTTTTVTNAQLQAMIDQGITAALAARDANRSTNGDDSHGTDGAVELIQWFEKMETVFSISNCLVENQIKFSTCTLLAARMTTADSTVAGYYIPKGSHVIVSCLGLGRNPEVWDDPLSFKPERHTHGYNQVVLTDNNLHMFSFGTGPRGCAGVLLGTTMTVMMLARLLQRFTWELPPNEPYVDLKENMHNLWKAKPLLALAKPRLPHHLYPI
ncbi:reverse transcriptase domain-containing protein [Tanacetum coccineum]